MIGRLTVAVALMLMVVAPVSAQTRRVDSGSASVRDFSFSWETRLVPPKPPLSESFGAAYAVTTLNEVHRILLDGSRRVYFGYTVRIALTAERAVYSLAFRPLALTPDLRTRFDIDATWQPLPAPQLPAFQTLRGGEVLELSLLSNDASAQRLLEYVTVQEPARTGFNAPERAHRELVVAPGTPRDFTVADAVLQLREPRLYVNGRLDASSQRLLGEHTGGILWIYIPKRGARGGDRWRRRFAGGSADQVEERARSVASRLTRGAQKSIEGDAAHRTLPRARAGIRRDDAASVTTRS
jgi:hypothetical protein